MATSPKRVKRYAWRILVSLILLGIGAYSSIFGMVVWYKNRPPTLQEAFPSGEIVIGVDASFPPFAVDNGESLYGLDIDLGKELAERIGLPVRFATMGYDGLYDSLIAGQVDIVISALLVNPARTRDVLYTQAYFDNGLLLVTTSPTITQMQDLPTHSLALEYGSNAHSEANFWLQRLASFELRPYELPRYALDSLRLGQADAALVDTATYWLYLAEHPNWESTSYPVTHAFYAIAIRYDREGTWAWVNTVLGKIIQDGRMDEIIATAFN